MFNSLKDKRQFFHFVFFFKALRVFAEDVCMKLLSGGTSAKFGSKFSVFAPFLASLPSSEESLNAFFALFLGATKRNSLLFKRSMA